MHVHCCQMTVCLCIHIFTLQTHFSSILLAVNWDFASFNGFGTESRIQVLGSTGFISSLCLLLIKFGNLKKNLHLNTLIQQIRETEENGGERLTMAFNSKPFQRRKSLPVILLVCVAKAQIIASQYYHCVVNPVSGCNL